VLRKVSFQYFIKQQWNRLVSLPVGVGKGGRFVVLPTNSI